MLRCQGLFTDERAQACVSLPARPALLALQAGADPTAKDEHGHTPAKVAAMHSHRAVVEALLRRDGGSDGSGGGGEAADTSGGGSVEAFMASSKADLKEREEKVRASACGPQYALDMERGGGQVRAPASCEASRETSRSGAHRCSMQHCRWHRATGRRSSPGPPLC